MTQIFYEDCKFEKEDFEDENFEEIETFLDGYDKGQEDTWI